MTKQQPAWLISKIDQRLALLDEMVGPAVHSAKHKPNVIVLALSEPTEQTMKALDKWERTCDACGAYCPWPTNFYTGHVVRDLPDGIQAVITFGVCEAHSHA